MNRKTYWDNIYRAKGPEEVSWYQLVPETSFDFVRKFNPLKDAKIMDVGGGDSLFADHLLDLGYTDITVLDISPSAINKAKERLKEKAALVKWVEADVNTFQPTEKYDFWHDRATFHFLTSEKEINRYVEMAGQSIRPEGILVIGTFSQKGPAKCSGLEIKQYSERSMADRLKTFFEKIRCIHVDHKTPFGSAQNFIFCSFRKLNLCR